MYEYQKVSVTLQHFLPSFQHTIATWCCERTEQTESAADSWTLIPVVSCSSGHLTSCGTCWRMASRIKLRAKWTAWHALGKTQHSSMLSFVHVWLNMIECDVWIIFIQAIARRLRSPADTRVQSLRQTTEERLACSCFSRCQNLFRCSVCWNGVRQAADSSCYVPRRSVLGLSLLDLFGECSSKITQWTCHRGIPIAIVCLVKCHHALVKHLKLGQNHEDFELKKLLLNTLVTLCSTSVVIQVVMLSYASFRLPGSNTFLPREPMSCFCHRCPHHFSCCLREGYCWHCLITWKQMRKSLTVSMTGLWLRKKSFSCMRCPHSALWLLCSLTTTWLVKEERGFCCCWNGAQVLNLTLILRKHSNEPPNRWMTNMTEVS